MDKNQGYVIERAVLFDNGRGVALGHSPTEPDPYVTWMFTQREDGGRDYEWGHYGPDGDAAQRNFDKRVYEYQHDFPYKARVVQTEAPGLYKYYSTQRPVGIGTFPKPPHNAPDEIVNYDRRIWVEHDTRLAWGHLTYTRPLTEQELINYELRPSRDNPDLKKRMEEQTQTVGAWEDASHIADSKRLTWFYPDFGCYVLKEYVSPEKLEGAVLSIKPQRDIAANIRQSRKKAASIADQLKEGQRQAMEQRPTGPVKDTPDKGDR